MNVTDLNKNNSKHNVPGTNLSALSVLIYLTHTIRWWNKDLIYVCVPEEYRQQRK